MIGVLGTIIAALIALVGGLVVALGTRQQALREAELIERLRALGLEESAKRVEDLLDDRIWLWSTRLPRFMFRYGIGLGVFATLAAAVQILLHALGIEAILPLMGSVALCVAGISLTITIARAGPWLFLKRKHDRSRYVPPPDAHKSRKRTATSQPPAQGDQSGPEMPAKGA